MNKNQYFKIGDLSKLYHIGVDSIRYYEKMGILKPERDPKNNYRLYTLNDIRKLAMIRELMDLNLSVEQIKEFDDHRTVDNSLSLLEEKLQETEEQIQKLLQTRNSIQARITSIQAAVKERKFMYQIRLKDFPDRFCIMVSDKNLPDQYVDYAVAEYMQSHLDKIQTIGACDCYTLDIKNSNPNSSQLRTKNVFFYSPEPIYDSNYTLPAGQYLSVIYPGNYDNTKKWVQKMIDYAEKEHMDILSDPIELCHINEYETGVQSEHVIEVQIQVKSHLQNINQNSDSGI